MRVGARGKALTKGVTIARVRDRHTPATSATKRRVLKSGPIGWRNWRAFELGTRRGPEAWEVALYSDSRFVDELKELGPYRVFNTVARGTPAPGAMALSLVLRVDEYGHAYIDMAPPMNQPTPGTYHGGWLADELAALMSLAGGFRVEAGETTRRFRGPRDRGRPAQWDERPASPVVAPIDRPMLPTIARRVNLGEIRVLLKSYPSVAPHAATALVRAARQFQRALLTAELDPNGAWLQLVSAVEVAAVHHVGEVATPWEVLSEGWPEVAAQLRPLGEGRRAALAGLLAPRVQAAARYRKFLREFRAPAPTTRPQDAYARMKWSKSAMSKALYKIYDHRSTALHAGIPFPSPMCDPPRTDDKKVAARGRSRAASEAMTRSGGRRTFRCISTSSRTSWGTHFGPGGLISLGSSRRQHRRSGPVIPQRREAGGFGEAEVWSPSTTRHVRRKASVRTR